MTALPRSLLASIVLPVSILACSKPQPPATASPRTPAPVPSPAPLAPPTDPLQLGAVALPPGAPSLPPLSGTTVALDLEKLATSTTRFRIEADVGMFGATTPEVAEALLAGLAMDPRWRVGLWEGQTVAWERQPAGKSWRVPLGGYHRRSPQGPTWRGQLRFAERPAEHPWSASELVGHNAPEDKVLTVAGWRVTGSDWDGQQAAALAIDGPGVSLEIHELAGELALTETARLLRSLTVRVAGVVELGQRGDLPASRRAFQLSGEPALVAQNIDLQAKDSTVQLSARLNPGAPGWTFVRIVSNTGVPWHEDEVVVLSAERIGHDTSPDVAFWYQATLPRFEGLPDQGRVEVWFRPDAPDRGASDEENPAGGSPVEQLLTMDFDHRAAPEGAPPGIER